MMPGVWGTGPAGAWQPSGDWESDVSWYKSELLIDNAAWNHREWPKLDLVKSATLMPWWHRARRWITDDRPCVERLLAFLEREVAPIPAWREEEVKQAAGLPGHWSVARALAVLAKALEHTGRAAWRRRRG